MANLQGKLHLSNDIHALHYYMITELTWKILIESQSRVTLSQLYWRFSIFNSLTSVKKRSESLSLWPVLSTLQMNPSAGFYDPSSGQDLLSVADNS